MCIVARLEIDSFVEKRMRVGIRSIHKLTRSEDLAGDSGSFRDMDDDVSAICCNRRNKFVRTRIVDKESAPIRTEQNVDEFHQGLKLFSRSLRGVCDNLFSDL